MPAHFGQIVYTSFAEAGFQCVTSAWLPPSILQSFEQEIVHRYWDAYDPPEKGFRGVYVHQVTVDQCLFGWVYSDLLDELGRCHVPYFHSYYLDELLHPALLESIFIFLQKGPVALVSQDSLPTHLETITAPDLWTYQPARMGISIPFELRKRCHDDLQRWKPINIFTSVNVVEEHQPQNERVPLLAHSQQQAPHSSLSETLEIVVPQRYVDLVPKRKSVLQRLEVALFGQNETQTAAPDPWTSINNGSDSDYSGIPGYEHEFEQEKRPSWAVPCFNIAPQLWLKGFSAVGVAVALLGAIYYGQPLGQTAMDGIKGMQWSKSPQSSQHTAEQSGAEQLKGQPKSTQSRVNSSSQPLSSPAQGGALTAPQSPVVPPAPIANQLPTFQPLPPLESPNLAPLPLSTPFPNPPAAGGRAKPTYVSPGQTTAARTRPQTPQVLRRSPIQDSIPALNSPPTQSLPPSTEPSFPAVSPADPPSSEPTPPSPSAVSETPVPSAAAISPPRADAETEPPLPPVEIDKPAVPAAPSKSLPIKIPEKPVASGLEPASQPTPVTPLPAERSKTPVLPAPRSWSEPAPTAP
jgi:hypothetical protein